jgi:hypothetical protein
MPVVKLISNPNRSRNPFKGQFLWYVKNPSRNDQTKGKVQGAGAYLFNHYVELIELEEYLIDELTEKVASKKIDTSFSKYPLDENLAKAYLWYKTFFINREDDDVLTDIWTDLRIQVNKVDAFIEEELKKIWTNFTNDPDAKLETVTSPAYEMIKTLNKKPFFKESLRLLSAWIQLVCKAKNIPYEISEKFTTSGAKFDVFTLHETKTDAVLQLERVRELKEKYSQYEQSLIKDKLSRSGAYTDYKSVDGDMLDLYFNNKEQNISPSDVLKQRKKKFIENDAVLALMTRAGTGIDFTTDTESVALDKALSFNQKAITRSLKEETERRYSQVGLFIQSIIEKNDKFDLTIYNYIEMNYYLISPRIPTGVQFSLKSLLTKLKQSKIDSASKYQFILKQWFNAQGFDIELEPYKEIFNNLSAVLKTEERYEDLMSWVNFAQAKKQERQEWLNDKKKNISDAYKKLKELEKPNSIVNGKTLQQEIKEKQEEFLKKANIIYSQHLGTIEGENRLSAYEVYQQKRLESDLKNKSIRDALPEIVTRTVTNEAGQRVKKHELVFKHIKKVPVYKKDNAGNVLMVDGQPVQEIEMGSDGNPKLDSLNNTIPIFTEVKLNIPSVTVEKLSDEMVDAIPGVEREIELSDDTAVKRTNPLKFAHMVKVKTTTINGITKDIITRGPFKGFSVEDLANATGRLTGDGKCYSVSSNGEIVSIYESIETDSGEVKVNYDALEEPYITWARDRFLIGLPNDIKHTPERKAIKKLSDTRASMEVVPGSEKRRWSFYFEGDDYEAIKDCLGSCLMSKKAHEELQKYYKMLLQKDRALQPENLAKFTPQAIGGFKAEVLPNKPLKFNNKQIEALAWLQSNGLKGVMALDTGVGKTLVGVASMQLASKEKPNAKFLIVGPDRLVGNFMGELKFFLEEAVAENLTNRTTEIGYTEFVRMYEEGADFKQYYCMIFDEVNEALKGKKAQAISNVKHPRKILLTGSALEKSPMDLFRFVSLSTGNPVDPTKEKAFMDKYAVNIGGKFVGVKPEVRHQFNNWVKQNAYFADKMDVDYEEAGQVALQPLQKLTTNVNMPKEVAVAYKEISDIISVQMNQIKDRYSLLLADTPIEEIPASVQREKDFAVGNLKDKISLLHMFSLNPHKAMEKFNKMKGNPPKEYTFSNPKIDQAEELAVQFLTGNAPKRTLYFTEDNDVAKKTVIKLSLRIPTKVHALCLSNAIVFYQAGKPLTKGRVTKKTKIQNFMVKELTEEQIKERLEQAGLTTEQIEKRMGRTAAATVEPQEEDMTWAVNTVKKFIAKNNQVSTMVANSSYARGFNLQQFKAVVHLDRDGWDSEELKQRTARAFRQGQEDAVIEVMVDAVMPQEMAGDITIDKLRGLVHEVDQKFFSDIITTSGAINLSANYDSIEHSKVTEKATKPNLENFARALAPTREMQLKIEERERGLREDPVKYTQLDPNRFNHPSFQNLSASSKKTVDLMGLSGIANVAPEHIQFNYGNASSYGDWILTMERTINNDYVKNNIFKTSKCAPNSIGNRALFTQLISMKKEGKSTLKTLGAGGWGSFNPETGLSETNEFIGYYVWPKFGYNAQVGIQVDSMKERAKKFEKMVIEKLGSSSVSNTTFNLVVPVQPQKPVRPERITTGIDPNTLIGQRSTGDAMLEQKKSLAIGIFGVSNYDELKRRIERSLGSNVSDFLNYMYFAKRNIDEEKEKHINLRLVINQAYRNNLYPLTTFNTIDPMTLEPGSGRFYDHRDRAYMVHYNNTQRQGALNEFTNRLNLFNQFVTPLLTQQNSVLITLFNKIQDTKRPLDQAEIQDVYDLAVQRTEEANIDFSRKLAEYEVKMEEYNQAMVIYNQSLANYDAEKQRFEAESYKFINAFSLDLKEIRSDIQAGVYSSEIKNWLGNDGATAYDVRYAKAAYIIQKSGKISPNGYIDIVDLYDITSRDENGKTFRAGEEYWKRYGSSQHYELDLNSNSKSYKKLTKYMNQKAKEAGFETLEQYLASPVEPFNTTRENCWRRFFEDDLPSVGRLPKSDQIQILKSYSKDLKDVLLKMEESKRIELLKKIRTWKERNPEASNIRVAKKKFADEEFQSYEQMMAESAEQDSELLSSIDQELANEEKVKEIQKEISVLKGDLKPVSNPFTKKKGK